MGKPFRSNGERFWEKVFKGSDCWEWQASLTTYGYGQFAFHDGTKVLRVDAHRAVLMLRGIPLVGICVLHECDNPKCVRPSHLKLGTKAENSEDMVKRGRSCRGVDRSNAVLTPTLVREIRKRSECESSHSLAREYGITQPALYRVIKGQRWAWVK